VAPAVAECIDNAQGGMPAVSVLGVAETDETLVVREVRDRRVLTMGVEEARRLLWVDEMDRGFVVVRRADDGERPVECHSNVSGGGAGGSRQARGAAGEGLDHSSSQPAAALVVKPPERRPGRGEVAFGRPFGAIGHLAMGAGRTVPGV